MKSFIQKFRQRLRVFSLTTAMAASAVSFAPPAAAESQEVMNKVRAVVAEVVTSGMNEREKALALHDWLINHAFYDTTFTYYEADGVLLHETGVCASYSSAYQLLLTEAGIECLIVTGDARDPEGNIESHAWNLIKVDGIWGHVDVTWDDPVPDDPTLQNIPVSGMENRLYFMASTAFMLQEHIPDEEGDALMHDMVGDELESSLPDPVDVSARVAMPDFSLMTSNGSLLTRSDFGTGKKLIMVFGRSSCGNTRGFLNYITPYVSMLKSHGISVVFGMFDDPAASEIQEMEAYYPGIVCAKLTDSGRCVWEALNDFGFQDEYVTFPVIILKNAQDKMTYYSTDFVSEPLKIVAGALAMTEDSGEQGAGDSSDPGDKDSSGSDTDSGTGDQGSSGSDTDSGKDDSGTQSGKDDNDTQSGKDDSGTPSGKDDNDTQSGKDDSGAQSGNDDGGSQSGKDDSGTQPVKDDSDTSDDKKDDSSQAGTDAEKAPDRAVVGGGKYSLNHKKNTAVFTAPKDKNVAKLKIPATVKVNGVTYKVTEIGKNACKSLGKLTNVEIGKNVTTIGKNAFNKCSKLKKVSGGAGVTSIGSSAFASCGSLTSVPAFKNLKTIGASAFKKCKALAKFTISAKVSKIGKNAFNGCTALKTIKISTTSLKSSNVGSGALKGTSKKAVFTVPKSCKKTYASLLTKKGASKTASVK